jgi:hypothetical protein
VPDVEKERPSRAKGLFKKSAVAAAAAAGLALAMPATPAAAINSVNCNWPATIDEYARVESYGLPTCFANAGAMTVDIHGVSRFHSGNNKVTFYYTVEVNGHQGSMTLEKWQDSGLTFNLTAHVTAIVIW